MKTHANKKPANKNNSNAEKKSGNHTTFQFVDNRSESTAQKQRQNMADNSPHVKQLKAVHQLANNNTGLPDNIKSGVENLSGHSLDDVKVHYNSAKPAQLNAHAYAQGSNIHVAPGQEKHLPHEAWHVVQQKQGRVQPTLQLKEKVNINDDTGLEKEADIMGAKALQFSEPHEVQRKHRAVSKEGKVAQRGRAKELKEETQQTKAVIKVLMPGSGDDLWRSRDSQKKGERMDNPDKDDQPTSWAKGSKGRITWTVAGPGGGSTKGEGIMNNGTRDIGSNSIENNKTQIPHIINYVINDLRKSGKTELPILILIKAHSRNAVAATQVAQTLFDLTKLDGLITIELVAFDPVPGPGHDGPDLSTSLPNIQSTLIYSVATQHSTGPGFSPQAVFGAKRIIISRQDHGGGILVGYKYDNKVYRGSNLNSLPEGVFVDSNFTGQNNLELLKVDSMDDAVYNLKEEFTDSQSRTRDFGRLQTIETVLKYYFEHKAPPPKKITNSKEEEKNSFFEDNNNMRQRNPKKDKG